MSQTGLNDMATSMRSNLEAHRVKANREPYIQYQPGSPSSGQQGALYTISTWKPIELRPTGSLIYNINLEAHRVKANREPYIQYQPGTP